MKEIKITATLSGQRVDKLCMKLLPKASKSFFYKMFRKKNIVLNKKKIQGDERLAEGDCLVFYLSDETYAKFSNDEVNGSKDRTYTLEEKRILYEDQHIIVYNKPTNILSQPNGKDRNLVDAATTYVMRQEQSRAEGDSVGVCNRLDRNTTGVTIIGKNTRALRMINEAIANHHVRKEYRAVVKGCISESIQLDDYQYKESTSNQVHMTTDRNKGVRIVTDITPVDYMEAIDVTVVSVLLMTGKTHQIRHHMASIGHPIIGDYKYGNQEVNVFFKRNYQIEHQLLHSYHYELSGLEEPLMYLNQKAFVAPFDFIIKQLQH